MLLYAVFHLGCIDPPRPRCQFLLYKSVYYDLSSTLLLCTLSLGFLVQGGSERAVGSGEVCCVLLCTCRVGEVEVEVEVERVKLILNGWLLFKVDDGKIKHFLRFEVHVVYASISYGDEGITILCFAALAMLLIWFSSSSTMS